MSFKMDRRRMPLIVPSTMRMLPESVIAVDTTNLLVLFSFLLSSSHTSQQPSNKTSFCPFPQPPPTFPERGRQMEMEMEMKMERQEMNERMGE